MGPDNLALTAVLGSVVWACMPCAASNMPPITAPKMPVLSFFQLLMAYR